MSHFFTPRSRWKSHDGLSNRKISQKKGLSKTFSISYNPSREDIEQIIVEVDKKMMEYEKKEKEIVLIGQSMGEGVGSKQTSWSWLENQKCHIYIYIGSPLHGARMIIKIKYLLPSFLYKKLKSPAWDYLSDKHPEKIPSHPSHNVSMGWFNSDFDGRVYVDETMLKSLNIVSS